MAEAGSPSICALVVWDAEAGTRSSALIEHLLENFRWILDRLGVTAGVASASHREVLEDWSRQRIRQLDVVLVDAAARRRMDLHHPRPYPLQGAEVARSLRRFIGRDDSPRLVAFCSPTLRPAAIAHLYAAGFGLCLHEQDILALHVLHSVISGNPLDEYRPPSARGIRSSPSSRFWQHIDRWSPELFEVLDGPLARGLGEALRRRGGTYRTLADRLARFVQEEMLLYRESLEISAAAQVLAEFFGYPWQSADECLPGVLPEVYPNDPDDVKREKLRRYSEQEYFKRLFAPGQ